MQCSGGAVFHCTVSCVDVGGSNTNVYLTNLHKKRSRF